jgi:hypothetical protein
MQMFSPFPGEMARSARGVSNARSKFSRGDAAKRQRGMTTGVRCFTGELLISGITIQYKFAIVI